MEFLGVGPLEIFFILIIALIILGPKDMVKTGRQLGGFLRKIILSDTWRSVRQMSNDIRYLPNKLMREAALDEEMQDLKEIQSDIVSSAKEMEASVKEVETTVRKEVDDATKDMDVAIPLDDLEKTAKEIDKNIASLSESAQLSETEEPTEPPVKEQELRNNEAVDSVLEAGEQKAEATSIDKTQNGRENTISTSESSENETNIENQ